MEYENAVPAEAGAAKQSVEDRIVIRMRKCGKLLSCLDEREKKELSYLLKKCLNDWKKEEK